MGWDFIFEFYPKQQPGIKFTNIKAKPMLKCHNSMSCMNYFDSNMNKYAIFLPEAILICPTTSPEVDVAKRT